LRMARATLKTVMGVGPEAQSESSPNDPGGQLGINIIAYD
jgi:hypothetical protein